MGDAEYLFAFHRIVMPIAMEFSPDIVISKFIAISLS
jgi:acetoin utilization deacetylase AcuC-like enzyme